MAWDMTLKLEYSPCPMGCTSRDQHVLTAQDRLHHIPGNFDVVRCLTCGLMRTDPRPSVLDIAAFYPEDYGPHAERGNPNRYKGGRSRTNRVLAGIRTWLNLDMYRLPLAPPGRLLEVGCAAGDYLEHSAAAGWDVEGIEFSEHAARKARNRGFRVTCAAIESMTVPERKFDLIVAWMVLEHLHDPMSALRKLSGAARPGGYLVLSVPDAAALEFKIFGARWYALSMPTHLYHFSPHTLSRLLADAGWRVVKVRWQANPNNMLRSLAYLLEDKGYQWLAGHARAIADGKQLRWLHSLLAVVLALTHQTGRFEVWAQNPARAAPDD